MRSRISLAFSQVEAHAHTLERPPLSRRALAAHQARPRHLFRLLCTIIPLLALVGCGAPRLEPTGSLASYDNLAPANGLLTQSRLHVNKANVLAAKTVRIAPTVFSGEALKLNLPERQRKLVANVADRALCIGLSERLHVVPLSEPADITVHSVITRIDLTDENIAGASKVAQLAPAAFGAMVPVPRIPVGLGGLSIEAEALNQNGAQEAAMLWARDANAITSSPKASKVGDAYDLAKEYGADFSTLIVTGASPFNTMPSLPSMSAIGASFGGAPKYAACDAFGRDPGLARIFGNGIGLPPEWTDDGASATAQVSDQVTEPR
ncbi:DUF3313 domain-containing protein [Hyphomicrobium sp. 2TAF46]|uniref:DUF3313 domain-containing protein n=1 Tax=Hyphomicrobium sp. 2TAF46 TaxID=3233019 RepID=UPI003F8EB504